MRRSQACRTLLITAILLLPTAEIPAAPETRDTAVVMGRGKGTVREILAMDFQPGMQRCTFSNIPPSADLLSLQLHPLRIPLTLSEWAPIQDRTVGFGIKDTPVQREGRALTWKPATVTRQPAAAAQSSSLQGTVSSPVSGQHTFALVYTVTNLNWRVQYRMVLRGDLESKPQHLSVDLIGYASLWNGTRRTYSNAVIHLVGGTAEQAVSAPNTSGFLMLNEESPLSDLWYPEQRTPRRRQSRYRLPGRVTLFSRQPVETEFLRIERIPAQRVYVMKSENLPLSPGVKGLPLTERIQFAHASDLDNSMSLPAGHGAIFKGTYTEVAGTAWIPHTGAGEKIRIDLGVSSKVLGRRRLLAKEEKPPDITEQTYELVVDNLSDAPITVEIEETPPVNLPWNLRRINTSHITRNNTLCCEIALRPGDQQRIRYTIACTKPRAMHFSNE